MLDSPTGRLVRDENGRLTIDPGFARPFASSVFDLAEAPEPTVDDFEGMGVEPMDFGKQVMGGFANVGTGLGWLAKKTGLDPEGVVENSFNDAADWWNNSLSDAAKQEVAKKFVTRDEDGSLTWGDAGLTSASLQLAGLAPDVATSLLGGGGMVKLLKTFGNPMGRKSLVETIEKAAKYGDDVPVALGRRAEAAKRKLAAVDSAIGIAGFGSFEGAYAGAQNASEVEQMIMGRKHEDLMESERYREIFDSTDDLMEMDERIQYAKETLMQEAGTEAFWKSGLATATLGAPAGAFFGKMLGAASLAKRGASKVPVYGAVNETVAGVAKSRAGAMAKGALIEGVTEGIQEGTETAITLDIFNRVAAGDEDILAESMNAGVIGAMAGSPVGGGFSAVGYTKPSVRDTDPDVQNLAFKAERTRVSEALTERLKGADIDAQMDLGSKFVQIQARENDGATRLETMGMYDLLAETGEMPRESRGLDAELSDPKPDPLAQKIQQMAEVMTADQINHVRTIDPITSVRNLQSLKDAPPEAEYVAFRADAQDFVDTQLGPDAGKMLAGHIGRILSDSNIEIYHTGGGNFVVPAKSQREQKRLKKALDNMEPVTLSNGQTEVEIKPVIRSVRADAMEGDAPWQGAIEQLQAAEPTPAEPGQQVDPETGVTGPVPGGVQVRKAKPKPAPEQPAPEPIDGNLSPEQAAPLIEEAANRADTSPLNDAAPTQAQLEAGDYNKGRLSFQHGVNVAIENPIGSVRSGTDPATGQQWSRTMQNHYGEIEGTKGKDGDQIDVFLGDAPNNPMRPVVVINQRHPDGSFDEHKVMMGFRTPQAALEAYRQNYPSENPAEGPAVTMGFLDFKKWLDSGDTTTEAPGRAFGGPQTEPNQENLAEAGDYRFSAADRVPGTKEGRKAWAAEQPMPEALPENYGDYFDLTEDTETVPIDQIYSTKQGRETDATNAAKFMDAAARGLNSKREPVRVREVDGRYEVVDGNATFKAAQSYGWKGLPVQVERDSGYRFAVAGGNVSDSEIRFKAIDPIQSAADPDISFRVNRFGETLVNGPIDKIRSMLTERGVTFKGRPNAQGNLLFTANQSPTVRGVLMNETTLQGRAGVVTEHQKDKDGNWVGAPPDFATPGKFVSRRRAVRQLLEEGWEGRNWYENSAEQAVKMFGGDRDKARQFLGLLAIYSPNTEVQVNTTAALKAWFQWQNGREPNAGIGENDRKALKWLRDGEFDSSQKVTNFYQNLASFLEGNNPDINQGATIDLWMMRAFGYKTDKPTQSQYRFAEVEVNKLAEEAGIEPHQVQAAMWVAIKARMNNLGVKRATEAQSIKAGDMRKERNDKGKLVRVFPSDEAEESHRRRWFRNAMNHTLTDADMDRALLDYGEAMISGYLTQISWEAAPGGETGLLPGYANATPEQRAEFLEAVQAVLIGPNGENRLAAEMGIPWLGRFKGPGVWKGASDPSSQDIIPIPYATNQKKGFERALEPSAVEALNAYAAILGRALNQEGMGWTHPDFASTKERANGVHVKLGREMTADEALALEAAVNERVPDGVEVVFVASRDGMSVFQLPNFQKSEEQRQFAESLQMRAEELGGESEETTDLVYNMPNFVSKKAEPDFHKAVEAAAESAVDAQIAIEYFRTESNLIENDWQENNDGQDYLKTATESGYGRAADWANRVLSPEIREVYNRFSERYGWGPVDRQVGQAEYRFSVTESSTVSGGARAPPAGRPRGRFETRVVDEQQGRYNLVGIHFSDGARDNLDGRHYGTGMRGEEYNRVMSSSDPRIKQRVYAYVDAGTGVRPEQNVGSLAHRVQLDNLYDFQNDPLGLRTGRTGSNEELNSFEASILDWGFDGYFIRDSMDGMGTAVIMGDGSHVVPAQPIDRTEDASSLPTAPPKGEGDQIADRLRAFDGQSGIPAGTPDGARWREIITERDAALAQEMEDAGVWATMDPEGRYYLSDLINRARDEQRRQNRIRNEARKVQPGWNNPADIGILKADEAILERQRGRTLDEIFDGIRDRQQELVDALREIDGEVDGVEVSFASDKPESPLGSKERSGAEDKMARKRRPAYTMTDIVRGGFLAETPEAADAVIEALTGKFDVVHDEGYSVTPAGYFDRKASVILSDGTVAEVQVWEQNLLDAKEKRGGHDMYEEYRDGATPADRKAELEQQMRDLYASALAEADPAWRRVFGKGGSEERIFAVSDSALSLTDPNASSYRTGFQSSVEPESRMNADLDSPSTTTQSRSQRPTLSEDISLSPSGTSIISEKADYYRKSQAAVAASREANDNAKADREAMDAAQNEADLLGAGWSHAKTKDGELVMIPTDQQGDHGSSTQQISQWLEGTPFADMGITVHRTHRDAPTSLQRAMGFDPTGQNNQSLPVEAAYDTKTGEVHVFSSMITSQAELHRILTEEIFGHGGLRALLGKEFDQFLDTANIPRAKLLGIARNYGLNLNNPVDLKIAREEYIAKLTPADGSTWNQFMDWLRQALRDLGLEIELTDAEAQRLMGRAREAVLRGEAPPASFTQRVMASMGDVTQNEAFKRWFGDSKVVDENGEPMVVYHGTPQSGLTSFSESASGDATGAENAGLGFFFTNDKNQAGLYSGRSGRIVETYISLKNPIVLRGQEFDQDASAPINQATAEFVGKSVNDITAEDFSEFRESLEARGYDGVEVELDDGLFNFIAFSPTQIKSATGNTGEFSASNPDIRFSVAERWRESSGTVQPSSNSRANEVLDRVLAKTRYDMNPGEKLQDLKSKAEDFFDNWQLNLKQGMLDSGASIEALERAVNDGKLAEGSDSAWKSFHLTHNLSNVMSAVIKYGVPARDDKGWFTIDDNGKGLSEIFSPLVQDGGNLLRLWEGYAAARRAKQLSTERNEDGTEREKLMSNEDIDTLLELGREYPVLERVFDEYQVFNRKLLDLAVDVGLLNEDSRDLWAQNDYVPFYRVFEDVEGPSGLPGSGGSAEVRGTGIQRLRGSERQLQPILDNITLNTANLIDKIYKHEAMKKIRDVGMEAGAMEALPQSWKPIKLSNGQMADALRKAGMETGAVARIMDETGLEPKEAYDAMVNEMTGQQRERYQTLFEMSIPQGKDVIGVVENGRTKYYRVTDPLLLRTIKGMGSENFGHFMKLMRGFRSTLTSMVTLDPGFMMANWMRDTLSAFVTSSDVDFKPVTDAVKSFSDIWTGKQDSAYAKVLMAGGSGGGFYDVHPGDLTRTMQDESGATILNTPSKILRAYRRLGNVSEQSNRIAIASAVLKGGGSVSEAAFQAQDVTNFTSHGDFLAMRVLTQTVPFLNARLQGLYKLYRGGRDNPTKFMMRGAGVVAATMLLLAKNWEDERYESLPDWQKDIYWHIFIGDQHFAIPKPFEAGVIFGALPERIVRLAGGKDKPSETGQFLATTMGETLALNPIPQMFKPMVEQWANKSFFGGRDIVPFYQERLAPEAQYRHYTSDTARLVADLMPDWMPEPMRSPARIEHMVRGYLGTMGHYMMTAADSVSNKVAGYAPRPESGLLDFPAVKRFVRGSGPQPTRYESMLWDSLREVDSAFSTMNAYAKQGRPEAAREMFEENRELLANRDALQSVANQIRELNNAEKQISFSLMDPTIKRERLDQIQRQKNEMLKRYIPLLYLDAR